MYTAKIPGRKGRVIAKVARAKEKARLQDQAEQQLEAEFNTLRQAGLTRGWCAYLESLFSLPLMISNRHPFFPRRLNAVLAY